MIMSRFDALRIGLSFDDVLLIPRRTRARSRRDVNVSTRLGNGINLNVPILSSNVPWCTEARMAIAMAQLGGLGVLHRMNLVAEQVQQVRAVKCAAVDLDEHPNAVVDARGRLLCGAAVGAKDEDFERARQIVNAGCDI